MDDKHNLTDREIMACQALLKRLTGIELPAPAEHFRDSKIAWHNELRAAVGQRHAEEMQSRR
jgi:hypothetical protein